MSARKARGDAKLKTLPPARQAQIVEHAQGHKLWETLAWLNEDGIQTSSAALSEFLSWYKLQARLERNQSTVEAVLARLKSERPGLVEEDLQAAGFTFFSALAVEQEDSLAWKRTQDARVRQEALRLAKVKFQRDTCELFMKWQADARAKAVLEEEGATNSQKIERLGQLMFGENWK